MNILKTLNTIAQCSQPSQGVTRLPFTKEHKQANKIITQWMKDAGMQVHLDAAGTLIGTYKSSNKNAKTLILGSHQDSVINAGRFDGIMGVLLPILAVKKLHQKKTKLPFHIECVAFADEEGVRFPTALMGPQVLAGTFQMKDIQFKDSKGISIQQALNNFGGNHRKLNQLKRSKKSIIGFVETHIEQGPVLEKHKLPVGVVTGISGITRYICTIKGKASHAGTTPMNLRKDALAGAAEIIYVLEKKARTTKNIIITVGSVQNTPNAVNVISGEVTISVESRSLDNKKRVNIQKEIASIIKKICRSRNLSCQFKRTYDQKAVLCDKHLTGALSKSVKDLNYPLMKIPSGATHDASAMSDLCPIAMLFVQSKDGLSHNPKEFSKENDMQAAVRVLENLITKSLKFKIIHS